MLANEAVEPFFIDVDDRYFFPFSHSLLLRVFSSSPLNLRFRKLFLKRENHSLETFILSFKVDLSLDRVIGFSSLNIVWYFFSCVKGESQIALET